MENLTAERLNFGIYMKTEILHGYVIKITPYSDYDSIVVLFTEEMGGISVFVKGLRRSQKRFQGSIDRFLYNEFEVLIKENGKLSILKSSKIIDSFYNIKNEPEKLVFAEHLIELYNNILTQFTSENFKYFNSMLKYINNSKKVNYPSLLVLRFNILKIAGIMPRVNDSHDMFFSGNQFIFLNSEPETNMLKLTQNQINFLIGFQQENQKILDFEFNEDEKRSFGKLFSLLYYSISNKKLLTIPLLMQFF